MKPKSDLDTIYLAALKVFADFGYKKATLEDIAGVLGMTKSNLYHYARSKRHLYQETVRFALLRWQGRVREAVAAENDARARFFVLCRRAVDYLAQDDDLRRLLVRDPDIFPMFSRNDPFADINANSVEMIRAILQAGIEEGRFRPVDLDAVPEVLFSIYKMFIIRMYLRSKDPDIQQMFTQTITLVTEGLFAAPAASPSPPVSKD
jgi:AcrR family transcriptional regulator